MTVEEAKKIYIKNKCSLFIMAREDYDNYLLYKSLGIDKSVEKEWRDEMIVELHRGLEKKGDKQIFNYMYDLAESFHDKEKLNLMIKSIDLIEMKDLKDYLCIAETIMGRKDLSVRSGMIFWAYDIGEKESARLLADKVLEYLDVKIDNLEDSARLVRNQKTINEISRLLKLK